MKNLMQWLKENLDAVASVDAVSSYGGGLSTVLQRFLSNDEHIEP